MFENLRGLFYELQAKLFQLVNNKLQREAL